MVYSDDELRPFLRDNKKWWCGLGFCKYNTTNQDGFVQHLLLKHKDEVGIHLKKDAPPKLEDVLYVGDVSKFRLDTSLKVHADGVNVTITGQNRDPNDKGVHKIIVPIPEKFVNANLEKKFVDDRIYIYKIDKEWTPADPVDDQPSGSNIAIANDE